MIIQVTHMTKRPRTSRNVPSCRNREYMEDTVGMGVCGRRAWIEYRSDRVIKSVSAVESRMELCR